MAEGRFSKLETGAGSKGLPGSIPREAPRAAASADNPAAPTSYGQFVSRGDDAFFSGEYRDALRFYSRAMQTEGTHIYPWIGQISALLELRQFKEAELWSNRALEHFPEDSSLLSQRARVLAATGNLQRAMGASDYALQKPGATEWTWLARGEVLLAADGPNALSCFEKAMELTGDKDWRVPMLIGLAYAKRRQWANSEEFLRLSTERNSRNHFAWFKLAETLIELNHTDRARDAATRVRQLNPDYRALRDLELRIYRRPFFKRILGVLRRK